MNSVFPVNLHSHLEQPMFLGESVSVSRYDLNKYAVFERLTDKQNSQFWRPNEIDLSRDRIDFNEKLSASEQHIFISNLKYQILLDSIQGRSPSQAFLPICSVPELETWLSTWEYFETIHSRAYSHIIRNVFNDPTAIFNSIEATPEIRERASSISDYYDRLIEKVHAYKLHGFGVHEVDGRKLDCTPNSVRRDLYLCMATVNVLEGLRFYVSFACTFAFAERGLMEGNAKEVKFIARDEALHLQGTQECLKIMRHGIDSPEMKQVAESCEREVYEIFLKAADQEKAWAKYLFSQGGMMGLNTEILCSYIDYLTNQRLQAIGLQPTNGIKENPLPWMSNWLSSDNVQVAPQEVENSAYLTDAIDKNIQEDEFEGFSL